MDRACGEELKEIATWENGGWEKQKGMGFMSG
jgi:hypothetical protein